MSVIAAAKETRRRYAAEESSIAATGSTATIDAFATPSLALCAANSVLPKTTRPDTMRLRAPFGPPAITRPSWTRSRAAWAGSGVDCRTTASTLSPSGTATVTRASTRTPSLIEAVAAIRGSEARVPTADVDARVLRTSDLENRAVVLRQDRPLQRQRRCELARFHLEVRAQRAECRGSDVRAA